MNKHSQNGVTLIIVLIVVLLVSGLSAMGIKAILMANKANMNQSITEQLAKEANLPLILLTDKSLIQARRNPVNLPDQQNGIFKLAFDNQGVEFVSCYQGFVSDDYFKPSITNISKIYIDENGSINNSSTDKLGFCSMEKSNPYSSSRRNVVTQVTVKYLENQPSSTKELYGINSISVMPKIINKNSGSLNQLDTCFSEHLNIENSKSENTVAKCLDKLNIPYKNFYTVLSINKGE